MVAPPRLELGHCCQRRILNPLRLPFRQEATLVNQSILVRKLMVRQRSRTSSKVSFILKRKKLSPRCFLSSLLEMRQEYFK